MFIRFNKGQFVDAVVPTAVGSQPAAAPGDIIWSIPSDVNPGKTVQETRKVQDTAPFTGALLFNLDGTPKWKTTTVTNPDGSKVDSIVTQQVPVTYKLMENPGIFTQADVQAVLINPPTVVSSNG